MERKSEWFCGGNFFALILKWSEKTVFEQEFAFSLVVFCSHAAISLWFLLFFRFFGSDFFLDGFSNPFTAHSRPSVLFELIFHFSLVVFCVHMLHFDIDFLFFSYFLSDFKKIIFSINSWSILGLVFSVKSMKFLWMVRQDLSCYVFLLSRMKSIGFTLVHSLFNILREIFLTSLG